jgi:hypothetical protein
MLVKQLAGKRAGEIVDIPMALALDLISQGRVQDLRERPEESQPSAPATEQVNKQKRRR